MNVRSIGIIVLLFHSITSAVAQDKTAYSVAKLIVSDDFTRKLDTTKWMTEVAAEPGSSVYTRKGRLVLDTKGGVTVWLNRKLSGNLLITYTRRVLTEGKANDRLSDMNQFWMATDPRNSDLFSREGLFEEYDSLQLYYVGMGGNANTTTRFRKYEGNGQKPLLQEYQDADHLLRSGKEYHIKITVEKGRTSFWVDGKLYFGYDDPVPLKEGYFGFRSTWSRQEIRDFKVYQLE